MNSVLEYVVNIFRNPSLFLGFFAMIGLILQKKPFPSVVLGTVKTIIGVIILFQGVDIIVRAITPLSQAFNLIFTTKQIEPLANFSDFVQQYSIEIGLVMIISFLLNILIARVTKFKVIFLTANFIFWFAMLFIAMGVGFNLPYHVMLILAIVFTTLYLVVPSNLLYPFVQDLTGSKDFTVGHSTSIFCFIGVGVGKLINKPEQSAEKLKLPPQLMFFTDTNIMSGLVIFITYFILCIADLIAHHGIISDVFKTKDFVTYSLSQGMLFSAGTTVLLLGSRMMLSEIIPSFKGISDKLVPGSVPALDVPMIFSFGMNSLVIGFMVAVISSLLTLVALGLSGILPYAIIPLIIACYFDVAPGSIFANHYGGIIAVVINAIIGGVSLMLFCALSLPIIASTVGTFIQAYGGNDFSVWLFIALPFFKMFQ